LANLNIDGRDVGKSLLKNARPGFGLMATNGGAIEKSGPCWLNRDRTERTKIMQDYVLESIFAAMERCKKADSFNAAGVFKGAELLGKHLGMFQGENQGITVNLAFDGWRIERTIVYPDTQP
jgi:hypothetical protein